MTLTHAGSFTAGSSLAEGESLDWRLNAACRDTDPDLFFPVGTTGPAVEQIDSAKQVCGACEAQQLCLEFALATNQDSGVWGGMSEDERRRLRRRWLKAQQSGRVISLV